MNVFEIFDVAIGIEKRLSNMYYRFSSLFKDNQEIHNFWIGVANHERSHSETLTMSKGYLKWNHPSLTHKDAPIVHISDIKELESLDSITKDYEKKTRKDRFSLQDTLEVLLNIENSELNHIYNRLVHISGIKLSQKPENVHKTIYEHMKLIKSVIDKHYRGSLPAIRIEDFKEVKPLPSSSTSTEPVPAPSPSQLPSSTPSSNGTAGGKIEEIFPEMSYGFIAGEDGQKYMFLPEDISNGTWEGAKINDTVEFSVMPLPWGPRATNINLKN
ncbi:MAG: hypothetical protein PH343_10460 [Nitrospira sp.]|nr:hypothetical protein [Nitrospira sp.]